MGKLTGKQSAFVDYYLICNFNGTEAAERAGYAGDRHALSVVAAENLVNPRIRAAIDERLAERTMSRDEVLVRLAEQARGSLSSFLEIDDAGTLTGFDFSKDKPLHLLKRAKVTETEVNGDVTKRTVEIEVLDPQAALFQLAKQLGLSKDIVELQIPWDKLTLDQMRRIRDGEDPQKVLSER